VCGCLALLCLYTAHPPPSASPQTQTKQILKEDCERNELRVREIRGEIELMQSLNHPNIVQVCWCWCWCWCWGGSDDTKVLCVYGVDGECVGVSCLACLVAAVMLLHLIERRIRVPRVHPF
jgi:hypothetical protein